MKGQFFGMKCGELLANYDPNLQSLKTAQTSLNLEPLAPSLPALPPSGMMRNGKIYQQHLLVPLTGGTELTLLPTLRANSVMAQNLNLPSQADPKRNLNLETFLARLLPTIVASEYKGSGRKRFHGSTQFRGAKMAEGLRISQKDPIYLSASFAEVMMGCDKDYTLLETQ